MAPLLKLRTNSKSSRLSPPYTAFNASSTSLEHDGPANLLDDDDAFVFQRRLTEPFSNFSLTSTYQYTPLDSSKDEIRLLELSPGQLVDPLKCSLYTRRLSDKPIYEALSYVWGDPTNTETIVCEDGTLEITINLAAALRRLRHDSKPRVLWVDAICINQRDIRERESQVTIMADLYRGAAEVVIWLGLDVRKSAVLAFELVGGYAAFVRSELERFSMASPGQKHLHFSDVRAFYPNGPQTVEQAGLDAITDLYSCSWFTRVWVLQEVGLAARASVAWGPSTIPFESLVCFAQAICNTSPSFAKTLNLWPVRYSYVNVWSTYVNSRSWRDRLPFRFALDKQCRLDDVLSSSCSRETTDRRDYIYSMLGHPAFRKQDGTTLVRPDYDIDFKQLCYDVTAAVITERKHLSIFSLILHNSSFDLSRNVSWVPNFEKIARRVDYQMFSSSKDRPAQTTINGDKLRCLGITIGFASHVFEPYEPLENDDNEIINALGDLWTSIKAKKPPNRYGEQNMLQSLASVTTTKSFAVIEDWSTLTGRDRSIANTTEGLSRCLVASHPLDPEVRTGLVPIFDDPHDPIKANFLHRAKHVYPGRSFFTTINGYWGLGPGIMLPEDKALILYGARVGYVLRPWGGEGIYKLVGECYVLGMMEGQILELLDKDEVEEEWITIC